MSRKKILLVDDSSTTLLLEQMVLNGSGYELHTAKDGDAGVSAALAVRPDLVLLDVVMPKTCTRCRRLPPSRPPECPRSIVPWRKSTRSPSATRLPPRSCPPPPRMAVQAESLQQILQFFHVEGDGKREVPPGSTPGRSLAAQRAATPAASPAPAQSRAKLTVHGEPGHDFERF